MPLAVDNLAASLRYRTRDLVVDYAERVVGLRSSQFYVCVGDDEIGVVAHRLARDMIVVDTALSLHAVECVSRNLKFSQEVGFYSEFLFVCHNSCI
mgnify:CR=1 FL=1